MQKGCGSCKDFAGLIENYHGHPVKMECAECDKDDCNDKKIRSLLLWKNIGVGVKFDFH